MTTTFARVRTAGDGEEAPGGSRDDAGNGDVDELGGALGVARAPAEEFRSSAQITEARDRNRGGTRGV